MPEPLLTPKEVMEILRVKDPHTLARMVKQRRLERFNMGGGEKQPRWRYRLPHLVPDWPGPSPEEVQMQELIRRHRL